MKLCRGTGGDPTKRGRRHYCPECFRPIRYKLVEEDDDTVIKMVMRHYPDGTIPKGRLGIPNKKVTTQ